MTVPAEVPVVTCKPGDKTLLVPGARVMVTAQMRRWQSDRDAVVAGRNGFTPPM